MTTDRANLRKCRHAMTQAADAVYAVRQKFSLNPQADAALKQIEKNIGYALEATEPRKVKP